MLNPVQDQYPKNTEFRSGNQGQIFLDCCGLLDIPEEGILIDVVLQLARQDTESKKQELRQLLK